MRLLVAAPALALLLLPSVCVAQQGLDATGSIDHRSIADQGSGLRKRSKSFDYWKVERRNVDIMRQTCTECTGKANQPTNLYQPHRSEFDADDIGPIDPAQAPPRD